MSQERAEEEEEAGGREVWERGKFIPERQGVSGICSFSNYGEEEVVEEETI